MSSTYAVREIDKEFQRLTDANYYYKECAINARSPANEADDYERSFMQELNADPKLIMRSTLRQFAGQAFYVSLRRGEMMEDSCLRCHGDPARAPSDLVRRYGSTRSFGRRVGETVSAISIRVPLAAAYATADRLALRLSALALAMLAALSGLQIWLSRRLVFAPLIRLRNAAQRIAADEQSLGQEIPLSAARELSDLTRAFNTMSRALRRNRDDLEERVRDRTDALRQVNLQLEADIIKRKQAEAEQAKLEAQNRQLQKSESLGRMAGAIAHHFNNQLQAVMGNLELALNHLPGTAGPVENLTAAMQSAHRAAEVSTLMLTYLGQTMAKREPLDLAETCQRHLPLLQASLPKNVDWEADLPAPGPVVSANANQIQQVLTNLVNNAWEASGAGQGAIRLTVRTVAPADIPALNRFPIDYLPQATAYACLEVADTGCGIANEDIERLFDPFFSSKFTGRGLGLSVVLGIVRAHQGVITVESEPVRGTVFRVFLPVSAEAIPRKPVPVAQAPATAGDGQAAIHAPPDTVLVVEDEPAVRQAVTLTLTRLGFTVLAAEDGVAAVEIFGQHREEIGCVLCDLTMPRMNGWETLSALRQLAPGIPVILSSGYSEAQILQGHHSDAERPQAVLVKPYTLKALLDAIARAMAKKSHPSGGVVLDKGGTGAV